ncbi:MAG: hypothetical protein IPH30_03235 [Betaproteobacteria bacterium]|nr:hypothetical protein [Betaproteobacteria bacterium]
MSFTRNAAPGAGRIGGRAHPRTAISRDPTVNSSMIHGSASSARTGRTGLKARRQIVLAAVRDSAMLT